MQQYRKNLGKVSLTAEGVWDIKSKYDVLSIVYDEHTQHGFISKQPIPIGVDLYNSEYWMPLNVSGYADSNIIILNKKTSDASIESYTLEEAIKSIASVGRKPGCILGFYNSNVNRLDIGGRWEIWQFNSTTISEWEDLSNWQNIYYNYNQFVGWYRNEEQLKINNPYPEIGCYAYVGNVLNEAVVYRCEIKHKWAETIQHAWDYVKVMIDGTVTVGENGNWYNNGEDTGIPVNVKGDPGLSPFIRYNTSTNKLEYSYDKIKWIECSDYISTWFRLNNNKLEISRDNAKWNPVSDYIAAWFRWQATAGDTQANNVGRIQMSRDNGKTWTNMSNDFTNNLHISRYIGVNESLPTSGIAEGTIYAKGPYYAEGDTSNDNPIYRLWVYAWKGDTLAWQDNGEFTSIAAGVVQETGDSETKVMSQKAVSEKLSELDSNVFIKNDYYWVGAWPKDNKIEFPVKSNSEYVIIFDWDNFDYTEIDEGSAIFWISVDGNSLCGIRKDNTTELPKQFTFKAINDGIAVMNIRSTTGTNGHIAVIDKHATNLQSHIKEYNEEIVSFVYTGDIIVGENITFSGGDFYITFRDLSRTSFYFEREKSFSFNAWDNVVYNKKENGIFIKSSDNLVKEDYILLRFDSQKRVFPNGVLFPTLSRKLMQPYVQFNGNVEVYEDVIQFSKGDLYVVLANSSYKTIYITDNNLKFTIEPSKSIVYRYSSNTIEMLSSSQMNEIDTLLLLRTDNKGRVLNEGLMSGYIVKNPIRFYKGYINWEDGKYQANEQRLYTNRYKFDHDVYIGFIKPIYDTASNVFLAQRIYLYENGEYKGLYMPSTGKYDSQTSYTTEEVFIPKNTEFAIVLKYSDETKPIKSIDELLSDQRNIYCISKTPISQIIPDYYFHRNITESGASYNYIDDKVAHIDNLARNCSMNGDMFIFITDVHFDRNQKHSPALIKYINEQVNIPRMFNGGDDYDGGYFNVYDVFESCFKGDYYYGVGNHDVDEYGLVGNYPLATYNNILLTHFKSKSYNNAVFGNYAKCYYYIDNPIQKIRYITLNSIGSQEHNYKPYDEEQLDWLKNVALDVEDGWTIIIFSHIVLIRKGTEYELQINTHAQRMLNVLENYNGNGIIAGVFCGDDHTDRVYRTPIKNIPIILTTTDGTARKDIAESPVGTINEQAFEVVGLNKSERKFTLVRVGRKAWDGVGLYDRGKQVEFREVYY